MSSNIKNLINLPNDLVENILFRLSPYHLARLKLTCKYLKLLIESPRFVDYYHKQAKETNDNSQLFSFLTDEHIYMIELEKLLVGRSPDINEYHALNKIYPMKEQFQAVGSCNGLLCFTNHHIIALYNPSMQADYTFSCPPRPLNYINMRTMYGFGYDPSTYDYKVVCIDWCSTESRVDVYSLNTKVWKQLQDFPKVFFKERFSSPFYSVLINNMLHWSLHMKSAESVSSRRVLCFDLCSEKLSFLSLHRKLESSSQTVVLDVLDGCLSALTQRGNGALDVWVMKDYGIKESWTKLITVESYPMELVKLIALSKDGSKLYLAKSKIYINESTKLYCYDIDLSAKVWDFKTKIPASEWVYTMQTVLQNKLTLPLDELK